MKFHFDLRNAGGSCTHRHQLAESTRMALIAWALSEMGHPTTITPNGQLEMSSRWPFFSSLLGSSSNADALVFPVEPYKVSGSPSRDHFKCLIGFKCSKKNDDNRFLSFCDFLIAHEYDHHAPPSVDKDPRLIPVPWPPHEVVINHIFNSGIAEAYVRDDLFRIREVLCDNNKKRKFGFMGYHGDGRVHMANQLPKYLKCVWRDGTNNITPGKYLAWLSQCEMGLHLPGDTPKANRFSELAMLGVPIVMCPCRMRDTPLVTSDNTILLRDYSDHETLERGYDRRAEIVENADVSYREGWSLRGQARQILKAVQ